MGDGGGRFAKQRISCGARPAISSDGGKFLSHHSELFVDIDNAGYKTEFGVASGVLKIASEEKGRWVCATVRLASARGKWKEWKALCL